jgi:hypothetical protein
MNSFKVCALSRYYQKWAGHVVRAGENKCSHKFEDNVTLDLKGMEGEAVGRIQWACKGNKTGKARSV